MTINSYRRNTCRLCNSSHLELVIPLLPSPIGDAYLQQDKKNKAQELFPLELFLCLDCYHLQLLDVVDPRLLFSNYTFVSSTSLGLVNHLRKSAEKILDFSSPAPGSLIAEIGSNDGSQLKYFKEKGFRVIGFDPALEIASQATASGIETIPAFFDKSLAQKIKAKHGAASIINANNVFAHSDQLADITDGIFELLAPEGVFNFEVSYLLDIIDNFLFDTIYHEHLCYHSIRPLVSFFDRHGLELINVEKIQTKGGSIHCTVQRKNGSRRVEQSVQEFIDIEFDYGLHRLEIYQNFMKQIEGKKKKVLSIVTDLKSQNKSIAGYGASPTVTTLLYYFELGKLLDFIVDDNPKKHQTLSPGHHIPVLPSETLNERKPDYVIILAWNYAQPIISKNEKYRHDGGHFIIPLPILEII